MAKKKRSNSILKSLLPHKRKDRQRVELLGAFAVAIVSSVVVAVFSLSSLQRLFLQSPNVAAVVSSVLVELLNGDRSAHQLGQLKVNQKLVEAAQLKANDMARKGYFSHTTPEGYDSWHWFKQVGYDFTYAGENLAVDFSESADVERAWMQSPSHRDNILQPNFTEVGIATAVGTFQGRTTVFAVQMFGAPAQRADTAKPIVSAPTKAEDIAIATREPERQEPVVLGETQVPKSAAQEQPTGADAPIGAVKSDAPAWGYVVGSPKSAMKYAYYAIAAFILLALLIDTGLEIRWHHARRAFAAAFVLVLMTGMFAVAEKIIFTDPVITQNSAISASAASGLQ